MISQSAMDTMQRIVDSKNHELALEKRINQGMREKITELEKKLKQYESK